MLIQFDISSVMIIFLVGVISSVIKYVILDIYELTQPRWITVNFN